MVVNCLSEEFGCASRLGANSAEVSLVYISTYIYTHRMMSLRALAGDIGGG